MMVRSASWPGSRGQLVARLPPLSACWARASSSAKASSESAMALLSAGFADDGEAFATGHEAGGPPHPDRGPGGGTAEGAVDEDDVELGVDDGPEFVEFVGQLATRAGVHPFGHAATFRAGQSAESIHCGTVRRGGHQARTAA